MNIIEEQKARENAQAKIEAAAKAEYEKSHKPVNVYGQRDGYDSCPDQATFRAKTIAAFMVAGILTLTDKNAPRKGKTTDYEFINNVVAHCSSKKARSQWIKLGRLSAKGEGKARVVTGLTAKGLNEVNASFQRFAEGNFSYSCTPELVRQFVQGMLTGKSVNYESGEVKHVFKFDKVGTFHQRIKK